MLQQEESEPSLSSGKQQWSLGRYDSADHSSMLLDLDLTTEHRTAKFECS